MMNDSGLSQMRYYRCSLFPRWWKIEV